MIRAILLFLVRWTLNTFGVWLSIRLFGTGYHATPTELTSFALIGFIFSVVNLLFKPIVVFFSFPFILLTLGLFMLVVNGFIVYLSFLLVPSISITFWKAMLMGVILSLINYILSKLIQKQ